MILGEIRLEWAVDWKGYTIDDRDEIVPIGGEPRLFTLEGMAHRVFDEIAQADPSRNGALRFTKKWGFLERRLEKERFQAAKTDVSSWIKLQTMVRQYIDLIGQGQFDEAVLVYNLAMAFNRLSPKFVPSVGGGSRIIYWDAGLLRTFICTEMVLSTAESDSTRQCKYCGHYFPIGHHVGRTRKRQFCGNPCKMKNHRRRKAIEKT